MPSETESLKISKFIMTSWDLVDHYLLATMLAITVASYALQTAQDRLICIPAIDCPRNGSALCNRSSLPVVSLFKMPDRRHYDYIDNECYKDMHWFSAYYSLIFLIETVILLAISNFWQKYPNSASPLARCEYLVSEYNKGDFLIKDSAEELLNRLKVLLDAYNKDDIRWGGVTKQYRLRGKVGISFTLLFLIFNGIFYRYTHGRKPCKLDDVEYTTEQEDSFFQCSRTMGSYFHIATVLFFVFFLVHLLVALRSLWWASTGLLRNTPHFTKTDWTVNTTTGRVGEFKGDAAFLLHLLEKTGCYFVDIVIEAQKNEAEKKKAKQKKVAEMSNEESEQLLEAEADSPL
ncbi:PREDICTED: volume-regulated anion channel subunit LRRC8C-like [Acropora digitifera]|uniref:volume-regulated anion channel subunit LRRC8C-like n=1 Tax=Acropora digitifera TaxID=70779 RepID=UPI00077A1404|nr:PREDICTED: volume-regulated anion channel subunit LRRC8C-like [Acropora digitifera]